MDQQPDISDLASRFISASQAGRISGFAVQTVTKFCRENPDLGAFVAGRWLLDRSKWDAFLRSRAGGGHAAG